MRRCIVLLFVALAVVGCAPQIPTSLSSQLNHAYQTAEARLELADSLQAKKGDTTLQDARKLLQTTRQAQKDEPGYRLLDDYAQVESLASRVIADRLSHRYEEKLEQMKSLRRRLAQLENRDTSIDRLKNEITQLQEDVIDQRQTISTLEDQLADSLDAIDGLKEAHNRQQAKLDSLRQRLDRTRETLTNLQKENRKIARMTRERLEDGDVKRRGGQVLITFQAGLLFEFGRAYIPEEARGRLDRVAKILKAFPDRPVRVYGHTDTTPVSPSNPYTSNWDLSNHRAVNVLKYLAYGRDVNKQRLGAVGFADRRPLVKNTTEKKRAQNRRVEIVMLPRNRRMVSADFDREESRSQNEQLRGQFEESVRTKNLRVRKGSLYVNLTEQLKFPTAEATLDTADREVLDKFGPIIEQYPDRPIRIQGHTDDLPMADEADYESNWELSAARAISVVKYLVKNYELRNHEIGASAMGQYHPLLPNTSDTNRQRNRRVEIILLPESYRTTSLDLGERVNSATQD